MIQASSGQEKSIAVLKFGGSSVSSPERILRVAHIVEAHRKCRPQENLIIVVSAMGDTTDELLELAHQVSPKAHDSSRRREMDMLLTAGERISMALLSLALADRGLDAVSLTGSQSGIITSDFHGEARIQEIKPIRIIEALSKNRVAIVAGFQGVSAQKEVTTLGRGGSDTSAVALGAHFKAHEVYIYTDVDGIYSANPRTVPNAKPIPQMSYREAYLSALFGAQVLHHRCLEVASKFEIPVRVLSSFLESAEINSGNFLKRGTLVAESGETKMETPFIKTLNHHSNVARLKIHLSEKGADALKKIQDSKLSWITLHEESAGGLDIICKASLVNDFKKVFPSLEEKGFFELLSLVGCGLSEAPHLTTQALNILGNAQLLRANDESLLLLCPPSADLKVLLPKLYDLCK